ncbi:phytanoyl-CoA dioxygenase family protein [Aspergillus undulatus]|uniref:phytanoyl-CoA dioxygenase family protein n=1 Tax=Aspergillus undulatus TaxID=1810928 RepID=UPI003CCE30AD
MPLQALDVKSAQLKEVFDSLAQNGGVSLRNLIEADMLSQISNELAPHYPDFCKGDVFTSKSRVISGIATKSTTFINQIACNPLFLEICDHLLTSTYTCWYGNGEVTFTSRPQINAAIAISNGPGNEPQKLHRDDMGLHHTLPAISSEEYKPGRDAAVGIFVGATKRTEQNGATRIIPGSRLWDTSRRPDENLTVYAELQPGDAFIMLASCFHAGSANRSDEDRVVYSTFYTKGYLRQEENQYLTLGKEQLSHYSPDVLQRLGFAASEPFHGWVDLKDPRDALSLSS